MEPIVLPINGVLDLHTFQPSEVAPLLADYLDECRRANLLSVRVIHGKGTGVLKKRVRQVLAELPSVASFQDAPPEAGGWGATVVQLTASGNPQPGIPSAPVDISTALERAMGDRALLAELLNAFRDISQEQLAAIEKSLADGNASALAQAAHRLKGSAANLSADRTHQLASRLENMGQQQTLAEAGDLLLELKQEIARMNEFIATFA